jgi:hypothetical protein
LIVWFDCTEILCAGLGVEAKAASSHAEGIGVEKQEALDVKEKEIKYFIIKSCRFH